MKNSTQLFAVLVVLAMFVSNAACYLEDINNAVKSSPDFYDTYNWWANWMLASMQGGIWSGCFFVGGWTTFWFNDGGYFIGYCVDKFLGTSLDGGSIYF